MSDTLITVIAIALAAILMFVFPLMTMSDRTDDVAQLTVETATTEFVDNVRTTGKITPENYDSFVQSINSTGNTYDVEIEIKVLDENPGKKTTQTNRTTIGENVYYSIYTSQIEDVLNTKGKYLLKEGDMVSVSVKNTNRTIAQMLKDFFYSITGNDAYQIAAQQSAMVTANGK